MEFENQYEYTYDIHYMYAHCECCGMPIDSKLHAWHDAFEVEVSNDAMDAWPMSQVSQSMSQVSQCIYLSNDALHAWPMSQSIYLSIRLSIHVSIRLSIYLAVNPSVNLCVNPSVNLCVESLMSGVHLCVNLSFKWLLSLSVNLCVKWHASMYVSNDMSLKIGHERHAHVWMSMSP